ncbi:hypothetical protein [Pontivivens nitratireducens]|uniref:hypothetical protein n=1 Tax=Pontivivens nitratireducens TaxID=2758038 RepID=UPI00163B1986|nr:hypothetical protein [Pontibrevibacter nitratireducens]
MDDYLAECSTQHGAHLAALKLHRVQTAAPALWGMPYASMIAIVRRQRQRAPKMKRRSKTDSLLALIGRLPDEWQPGLVARMGSEPGNRKLKWSADHLNSVTHALLRWLAWCDGSGNDIRPAGMTFHAYACDLSAEGVSKRSASDYLGRILSGYSTACDPGFASVACEHVISGLNARGKVEGRPTKTGEQLVGASTIFDLGMEIVGNARALGPRDLFAARDYRNGLLLALAAAVPQRARALSHFEIGRTIMLLEWPCLHVRLPGSALKLREYEKEYGGYDRVLESPGLWDAIDEYNRVFRPLFDDGNAMFPSILEVGARVSAARLGCLVGNLTHAHLGVRVSVHRVRDNVATEASEELLGGGYIAPVLLDNRNPATTMASYDHAQGVRAARDHIKFVASRRSYSSTLRL